MVQGKATDGKSWAANWIHYVGVVSQECFIGIRERFWTPQTYLDLGLHDKIFRYNDT